MHPSSRRSRGRWGHTRATVATASVAAISALAALVGLAGCSDGTAPPTLAPHAPAEGGGAPAPSAPTGALRPLVVVRPSVVAANATYTPGATGTTGGVDVPTYDGSGQVVHPDVVVFREPWNGHRYWMAITPYPNGNANFENPSLMASDDGVTWRVPAGAPNPVVQRPAFGYNSDPDLVYRASENELWLYYRHSGAGKDEVWLTRTRDGATWTAPQVVFQRRSYGHVSPAVSRGGTGPWRAWYVDAGLIGCRATQTAVRELRSNDGLRWHPRVEARTAGTGPLQAAASPVRLTQPGYVVWHLDVQYVEARHEYWALYAAYRRDAGRGCLPTGVFLATSPDGVTWTTFPAPLLASGESELFRDFVYRSSFFYDASQGTVTVWYSGATIDPGTPETPSRGYVWSAAVATYTVDDVFARVHRTPPAAPPPPPVAARAADRWEWPPNGRARWHEEMP